MKYAGQVRNELQRFDKFHTGVETRARATTNANADWLCDIAARNILAKKSAPQRAFSLPRCGYFIACLVLSNTVIAEVNIAATSAILAGMISVLPALANWPNW